MSKSLDEAVKEFEKKQKTKKWVKHKKQITKTTSNINRVLDFIEGKPSKTQTIVPNKKQQKRSYIIRDGVAYPVYRSHKKTQTVQGSAKPRRGYDVFGSPVSKNKKKKKKDPFDLRINW